MSGQIHGLFLEHSRSKHGTRTVGGVIAEAAHLDGVGWLRIEPTKKRVQPRQPDKKNIVVRANLSAKQTRRCVDRLQDLDELEVVWAYNGRQRFYIYRLIVGPLREMDVDYERGLPELEAPFWTPDELTVPWLERRLKGHALSPSQQAKLAATSGQIVPSSASGDEGTSAPGRADICASDEGTSAPPPKNMDRPRDPSKDPSLTGDSEIESPVPPADADGERERLVMNLELALSVELGGKPVTRSEYGAWKSVVKDLADADATVDEVRERCAAYRARWPQVVLTPVALARHWTLLGGLAELEQTGGNDIARWIETSAWRLTDDHVLDILDGKQLARDAIETHLERCRQLRIENTTADAITAEALDAAREAAA